MNRNERSENKTEQASESDGWTNAPTGRSYTDPLNPWAFGGTGAMAVLFNPEGHLKGIYRTPISNEDWKKIKELSSQTQ